MGILFCFFLDGNENAKCKNVWIWLIFSLLYNIYIYICMSFRIIVARYNENVEWTKQFPNVIIYNKGDKLDDGYDEIFFR